MDFDALIRQLLEHPDVIRSRMGLRGSGYYRLLDRDGELIQFGIFGNLITDPGDVYYATRGAAGVLPQNNADATKVTGMKLGTGVTAAAKNGAGGALVTYTSGSNKAFDATFPTVATKGAGLGERITYQVTWGAGVVTANGLAEAVIVNDSGTDATSTGANTISRALLSPVVNKGVNDSLIVTWYHDFLGA